MSDNQKSPLYPWRLDTNDRYKDAVKIIMDLSTASLVLPVFFLRDILQIPKEQSLSQVLTWKVYMSWICLAVAILLGFIFYYASAKWVRIAWGKEAGFFLKKTNDKFVEKVLNVSFVGAVILFLLGLGLILCFVVSFKPNP
jgi:magnesium-transporting ATPase (P-type)